MNFIFNALKGLDDYNTLLNALTEGKTPAIVTGALGIHKCVLTAALCAQSGRKALVIATDEAEAQRFAEDLSSLSMSPSLYPMRDFSFRNTVVSSHEYERLRLESLTKLLDGRANIIVSTIDAALQYTIGPEELASRLITVRQNTEITPEVVTAALVRCGYTREEQIEGTGQFSRRGGIIDFFSPGDAEPVRIEFWGDEIDSISHFDISSQRRTEPAAEVTICPCIEAIPENPAILAKKIEKLAASLRGKNAPKAKAVLSDEIQALKNGIHLNSTDKFISLIYEKPATLFEYFLPENSFVVFSEGNKLKERMKNTSLQSAEDISACLADGILCKGLDSFSEDYSFALQKSVDIPGIYMDTFARGSYETPTKTLVNINARQLSVWGGGIEILKEDLSSLLANGRACAVLAGNGRAASSVAEDLKEAGLPCGYFHSPSIIQKGTVTVVDGSLSAGFEFPDIGLALISHGRYTTDAATSRRSKRDKNSKGISSLSELSPGDYVVHTTHGIGVFEGIHKIEMDGITKDYIKLRYARMDTLYVPVTQLDLVAKYIGPREDSGVKLNRLGGADWQKAKTRVRSAVKDIAKELITLYAQRMQQKGYAFPPDGEWQHDFEAHFEYDETDDQLRCINEIKDDMESTVPMDRLLCGDVGFGKTEVALRAAFKCVTAGKQCALLVPTTILAWQHFQTITRRMESFPVDTELLSRFRTPKQQAETLKKLKRGSVDIVVGTHRLVSKDVAFRDLGLVIIDEEQRFGVAQKEKLKTMCKSADVLTLSATPIPRTLNMALSGIRDMSVIEEAPHDRHPVQSYVVEYDLGMVADAIRRELRRGGQVYYLHNDVASIERTAMRLREYVPEARIGIGHGKMDEEELTEVWRKLLDHEIDILVCTTIIETGVDVQNANTLIIENADRMGLSQLHQLRGRVGRSSRRAYAYFTYTKNKVLTEIATKRLSAIREFTEFGSGFKIAMRDLEIRGAGNILGGEQHGHMEAVGYDLYVKLLSEAVGMLKGEKVEKAEESCLLDMQVQAHIPESYIESSNLRLEIYRRIADIRNEADAMDVTDELIDRFGEPPEAVKGLINIALLRNSAAGLGISEIKQQGTSLLLFKNDIDMKAFSVLAGNFPGKILLSAGSRPYISVKLGGASPVKILTEVLSSLSEAEKSA